MKQLLPIICGLFLFAATSGCGGPEPSSGEIDRTQSAVFGETIYITPGSVILCDETECHGSCEEGGFCGWPKPLGCMPFWRYRNLTSIAHPCIDNGKLNGVQQCKGPKPSWATQISGPHWTACQ